MAVAKKVAKKSVKPVAKKAAAKATTRRSWDDNVKLKFVRDFPAQEGSAASKLFAAVKRSKTVGEARKATARLERSEMLVPYLRFWTKRGELKVLAA
jgi:hypothetical protein